VTTFVLRRLLQSVVVIFGISAVVFFIMHAVPGGPLAAYRDQPGMTAAELAGIARQLGVDRPVWVQYVDWLGNAVQGNFGYSYTYGVPAARLMWERLPATAELMLSSFAIAVVVAFVLGVSSAVRHFSWWDYCVTLVSYVGISLPTFVLGILALIVFSVELHWFPSGGIASTNAPFSLGDRLRHLALPALVLAFYSLAGESRYVRSSMLDILGSDYVRTARAKGVGERAVIYRHAARTALLPVVTVLVLDLAYLFGGTLVTEQVFAWPGMGRLFFEAVLQGDYPVMMIILSFLSVLIVLSSVAADILYAVLDPRIRYS
jgi:peptide/nickel transport system permease protein